MILFISFSGPDGVGKSTIMQQVLIKTKYKYVAYDRDIPDQICYAKLANRKLNIYWQKYMYNNKNQLYVILNANINTIKKRMLQRNDNIVPKGTTLKQAIDYFRKTYKNNKANNILYINNTNLSIKQVIDKIINKLKQMEQNDNKI